MILDVCVCFCCFTFSIYEDNSGHTVHSLGFSRKVSRSLRGEPSARSPGLLIPPTTYLTADGPSGATELLSYSTALAHGPSVPTGWAGGEPP